MPFTAPHRTDRLLAAIDPLPHPERMRQLALDVGELVAEGALRPVLEELAGRGAYGNGLAVVAASVGRDTDWIAARLDDPDRYVRGHALRAADSVGVPDAAFAAALQDASAVVRRDVLHHLAAGRRPALADRLLGEVRATWGEQEAARLLPGCGAETVRRALPDLFHAARGWNDCARRHPVALLDALERDLAGQPETAREGWWTRYGHAVALVLRAAARATGDSAAGAVPRRVIGMLDAHPPARLPAAVRDALGLLATAEPEHLVRLLRTPFGLSVSIGGYVRAPVLRRIARHAPWNLVVGYARALVGHHALLTLIGALPPSRREALYLAAVEGRDTPPARLEEAVLGALPRSAVTAYARRMADRERTDNISWSTVLRAESYLPPAEVRDTLTAATRRPVAEDRAVAWPLLIANASRSHDTAAMDAVLEEMARLRNEQDPVRSAALTALAGTPAALFGEASAPHLERIATDAAEARDTSASARGDLGSLAVKLLRAHPQDPGNPLVRWALRTLAGIARGHGEIDLGVVAWRRADRDLGQGQEQLLVAALLPLLEAAAQKDDHRLTLTLTAQLGSLAHRVAALGELLWQAARSTNEDTARTAIEAWLAPPTGRSEKVARLLDREPAAAVVPQVLKVLTTTRTDLLDQVLGEGPPQSRFLDEGQWLAPVGPAVRRWVPRQHLAAAQQLSAVAADEGVWEDDRVQALRRLAVLPGIGADEVRRRTGDEEVVVAEAALSALALTDRPADALPELLALAGTNRARVAVHAATGASRHVRPSRLATLLDDVLGAETPAKVTGAKETVRLAALRLPLPTAVDLVTRTYATPGRHHDVRAACVSHASRLLDDARAWRMLQDAAAGGAVADAPAVERTALRAAVLGVAPGDLAEPLRPRYAGLVREVCRTDDPELAVAALGALGVWAPWLPGATDVLVAALTDLTDRRRWRTAAEALVAGAPAAGVGRDAVLRALNVLATAEEPDRDLPARYRLDHLVSRLCALTDGGWGAPRPEVARPVLREAGGVLRAHEEFVPHAAELLVRGLELDAEPGELDAALTQLGRLLDERPAAAVRTAEALSDRIGGYQAEGDQEVLLGRATALAAGGGHATGLLAVAITEACGGRTSWAEPWRECLRALREHPVRDVRDEALGVTTRHR
ncbi:hypothetical protein [Streptomyces sp. NPDC051561]|uniref:hypothetical protein n=1 Tax=Streptomyces sp. NPDC051561 TaxID=3365658 RepID=UPI0037B12B45